MKIFAKIVGIALVVAAADTASARAATLSLQECLAQAIDHSPALASGRHLSAAFKDDMVKKRGTTLPFFSGMLQAWELNGQPATQWYPTGISQPGFGGAVSRGNPSVHWAPVTLEEIGVTYPLISEGSILGLNDPPPVASARANMNEQDATNLITLQKVVLEVVNDYTYVTSYREQLATARETVARAREQLVIVKENERLGLKLPQDVETAQARLDAAEQFMRSVADNLHSFMVDLAGMIGQPSGAEFEVAGPPPPTPRLVPLEEFLDQVMPGHPALRVQEAKVEVQRQQLRADQGNFWPSATLTTDFTSAQDLDYFNGRNNRPRPTEFQSYLSVNIPVFDFGQRRAAIDESKENVLAQQDTIRDIDRQTRSSIATTYNTIMSDAQTAATWMSEYVKDDRAAALARAQADAGVGDELTWVQDQLTALTDKSALQATQLSERLQYAALQNLSAGTWHWLP